MEKIKITFLGTSDAIPSKKRNHQAILLSYKSENILIDCGEGTQRQFKIANLNPCKLTNILITHWHGDHVLGLPGLLQTLKTLGYPRTLKIYGPKGTKDKISALKKFTNIDLPLEIHEVTNKKILDTPEFYIETKPMHHTKPTNAYSFTLKEKRRLGKNKLKKYKIPNSPLLKELQQGKNIKINNKTIKASQVSYLEKGKKITFILDTKMNQNAIELANNSDLLISESTHSSAEKDMANEYKHLTNEEAATIAKKAKVKQLILTHISQRYQTKLKQIESEAKKIFKNTSLANDFDKIEI